MSCRSRCGLAPIGAWCGSSRTRGGVRILVGLGMSCRTRGGIAPIGARCGASRARGGVRMVVGLAMSSRTRGGVPATGVPTLSRLFGTALRQRVPANAVNGPVLQVRRERTNGNWFASSSGDEEKFGTPSFNPVLARKSRESCNLGRDGGTRRFSPQESNHSSYRSRVGQAGDSPTVPTECLVLIKRSDLQGDFPSFPHSSTVQGQRFCKKRWLEDKDGTLSNGNPDEGLCRGYGIRVVRKPFS